MTYGLKNRGKFRKVNQELSLVRDKLSVPVASRSKMCVCGRSLAGIVGSVPAGGMDVGLLEVCVLSMRRSDPSSRGILSSVCH